MADESKVVINLATVTRKQHGAHRDDGPESLGAPVGSARRARP